MNNHPKRVGTLFATLTLLTGPAVGWAQQVPADDDRLTDEEETIVLSPFEVESSREDEGYTAQTTLAGNRLNTELRDIGNAVTVITPQLLKDIGATDNTSLLQYTPNTEVGSIRGNFVGVGDGRTLDESGNFGNPNNNTRVRGLSAADNTRDFFLTDIPWDAYNIGGIDLQRGPNSILFGQGKPAGIINARTSGAVFNNTGEVTARYGSYDSTRASLNVNRVLLENELALRIAALYDDERFQQDPAFRRSKRIYGATRWEPGFLNQGSARTIIKANFEAGEIRSNYPRQLPPYDNLTPWFQSGTYQGVDINGNPVTYNYTDRATYTSYQLEDRTGTKPNHGNRYEVIAAGSPYAPTGLNPAFNPWIGNWGQFGNPIANFDGTSGLLGYTVWEASTGQGLNANGTIDGTIEGIAFARPGTINSYSDFSIRARLPNSSFGIYKDRSLTDPSVFNFYDQLLEGPNKREWMDFRVYNASLAQTFLNDKLGFEATYNRENVTNGQVGLLGGAALYVDINSQLADRTANPNVGRPFIAGSQGNNRETESERESSRLTVFGSHDFADSGSEGWLTRILGRHTVTGLLAEDEHTTDFRRWHRYGVEDSYLEYLNRPSGQMRIDSAEVLPLSMIYLGPSLLDRSTAAGANIPNPTATHTIADGQIRVFDSTWNAPEGVNPSDPWLDTITGTEENPVVRTQSENPANYVGWSNMPFDIIDSEGQNGNRERLTVEAGLNRRTVSSKAFVWQGHLLDEAIVGTWGIREDESEAWGLSRTINDETSDSFGRLNLNPDSYRLSAEADNRLKVTSRAWTVVAHLNELPGLREVMERFPLNVSLFYNESSNFEALAQRVDFLGQPISAPEGETIDQGIRLETKDGRFSLRVNKYETTVTNGSSTALGGAYFIGVSQALAANWVNRFEYNWVSDDITGDVTSTHPDPHTHPWAGVFRYQPQPGETQEQADAREAGVVAAWRDWQGQLDPRFYEAWGIDLNDNSQAVIATVPVGFAVTEDSRSEGYEIELSALPLRNWRVAVNASKTEAQRYNIGGAALTEFMDAYQNALNNTPVGDLRIWWGSASATTSLIEWNRAVGAEWAQRKLQEGTAVPELREWRVNGITNYEFDRGTLKGVNVGGAVRYESAIATGYRPIPGELPTDMNFDIANPYMGPSETNFDFWVGYRRKLSDNINWRVQLNVRNAFQEDELIPITVQPDGSPAAYRIAPSRTWEITNTFEF